MFDEGMTNEGLLKMKDIYDRTGERIWIMNPTIYKAAGASFKWNIAFSQFVVRRIFMAMQIRRTMTTRLTLPDGSVSYPAEGLPPATIRVQELDFSILNNQGVDMRELGRQFSRKLIGQTAEGDLTDHSTQPDSANQQPSHMINFGVHRQAVLSTFDPRNLMLMSPGENDLHYQGSKNELIKHFQDMRDDQETNSRATSRQKRKGKGPQIGVSHVEQLINTDINGGLTYLYYHTRQDPHMGAPSDRAIFLHWLASTSPIMTEVLSLSYKTVRKDKQRLLVYVDTPWIQQ